MTSGRETTRFADFEQGTTRVDGVGIAWRKAGTGPPLLLLHGHPQTMIIWDRVAPALSRHFTVVASDLRGYGASAKPPTTPDHAPYSKRAMAHDQVGLMKHFGYERFRLVGHDRGGRVAHRLSVDHPHAVERLAVLDIAPTLAMYEQTGKAMATTYWHWFFLIQPAPMPETLIAGNPLAYLKGLMGTRHVGYDSFTDEARATYLACVSDPATVHAMCEDYRAAASIDLVHDRADRDAGIRIRCPLQVLWGRHGVIERDYDALAEWRKVALDVRGEALDCGHYIPEEAPHALLQALDPFLRS